MIGDASFRTLALPLPECPLPERPVPKYLVITLCGCRRSRAACPSPCSRRDTPCRPSSLRISSAAATFPYGCHRKRAVFRFARSSTKSRFFQPRARPHKALFERESPRSCPTSLRQTSTRTRLCYPEHPAFRKSQCGKATVHRRVLSVLFDVQWSIDMHIFPPMERRF